MELNREQIIKALECCASNSLADCDCCPIDEQKKDNCECGRYVAIQALALIRDLTEEKEVLSAELSRYTENVKAMVDDAKADTVRKMQERVFQLFPSDKKCTTISRITIEQIAREMMEEE